MGHRRKCPFPFLNNLTCSPAKYFPVITEILVSKLLILIVLLPPKGQQVTTCTSHGRPLTILSRIKKTDYQRFSYLLQFLGQMHSSNTMTAEAVDKCLPWQSSPLQDWTPRGVRVQSISPHPPMAAVNSLCVYSQRTWWVTNLWARDSQGLSRRKSKG